MLLDVTITLFSRSQTQTFTMEIDFKQCIWLLFFISGQSQVVNLEEEMQWVCESSVGLTGLTETVELALIG